MKKIGIKRCKIIISGQKLRSGTGTKTGWYRYHHHKPIGTGTGTDTSGTGTTIQNVYGTGTEQSGTGTTLPKMPRFECFCIVKLKFTHRLYRNLTK